MAADGLLGKKRARPNDNVEQKSDGDATNEDQDIDDDEFDEDDAESGGSNARVLPSKLSIIFLVSKSLFNKFQMDHIKLEQLRQMQPPQRQSKFILTFLSMKAHKRPSFPLQLH